MESNTSTAWSSRGSPALVEVHMVMVAYSVEGSWPWAVVPMDWLVAPRNALIPSTIVALPDLLD